MYEVLFKDRSMKILDLLLDRDRTLTELSIELDISKPTVQQRYINDLIAIGVLEKRSQKTSRGRETIYSLKEFSLHISIERNALISFKSHLRMNHEQFLLNQIAEERFRSPMEEFIRHLKKADRSIPYVILFGSVAVDQATEKSDIDILMLDHLWDADNKDWILDLLSTVSMNHMNPIKPIFMNLDVFKNGKDRFIREIKDNGIILSHDRNEDGAIWSMMKRYRNISF